MAIVWKEIGCGFELEGIKTTCHRHENGKLSTVVTSAMFKNNSLTEIKIEIPPSSAVPSNNDHLRVLGYQSKDGDSIELERVKYISGTTTQKTISLLDSSGVILPYIKFTVQGSVIGTNSFDVKIIRE